MSDSLGDRSAATRAGFVRFQQELAGRALLAGSLGAARIALRVLKPDDFDGDRATIARFLKALRDAHSGDEEVLEAIRGLIQLAAAHEER